MLNTAHAKRECDENCRGCLDCYVATGDTVCDWNCKHTAETHADDIAEADDDGRYPHDAACECDTCRMERARDTAEEYAND